MFKVCNLKLKDVCVFRVLIQRAQHWPWRDIPVNLGDNAGRGRRFICFRWFMSVAQRAPHDHIFLRAILSAYNEAARIM